MKFYNNVLEILVKRMNFTIGHIFRENGTMSFLVNNSWTGPIGRVASKQADVAVAPLTISTSRLTVCDFTTAVYREGVFLHVKKPGRSPIPWFSLFEVHPYELPMNNFNISHFSDFPHLIVDRVRGIDDCSFHLFCLYPKTWDELCEILSC